ncbi:P-loop containing nucleoside triphosphate hydrolase protein [Rhodotorula diobovata]|uniref:Structural maintenance of chromosomes protein 5 n=1 Tax=Rhodotorula diobovata TaxID=5288 RepID=A0A5C5G6G5_9BASI|nr:P-loop containing nucleoside triphosphate hydrolase protein [Rhodotorula diobovata]
MSDADGLSPMPSGSATKHRTALSDSDADADTNDHSDSSPRSRKRAKLEHATGDKGKGKARVQDSDDDQERDPEDQEDEDVKGFIRDEDLGPDERQLLVRHNDGYVTGSIVRIACHSFLTYDSVEFRPGPALNMIIGPNGTGKSTIACAIAIGLGFPAKVLGRSTKLSAYCKNDSNEATWIEIELKGKPGQKNLVVRRHLSRDSEKTRFELDGEDASSKAVMEQMEQLQVQVGNLCTFLPQDRVASFAMMTPPELLRETQRAAGNENLTTWHQVLIQEFKKCREVQLEVTRLSEQLARKQTKQAETEKEVRAFEQRARLEQDRDVVEVLVKFGAYHQVYEQYLVAREAKTVLQNEVAHLEEKNRPFRDSMRALEGLVKACRKEQDKVDKKVNALLKDADQYKDKLDKLLVLRAQEGDRESLSDKIREIKKSESERRKRIDKLKQEIDRFSALAANEPAEADTADLDRQIRDKSNQRSEIVNQAQENHNEVEDIHRRAEEHLRAEKRYEEEIAKQQQVALQRERALEHFEPVVWKVVQWLRANKNQLRGRVFEPPRLYLGVKKELNGQKLDLSRDPQIVDLVEGPIPLNAFSTFLFEFQEDYDKMYNLVCDEPNRRQPGSGLKFSGVHIDVNIKPDQIPRPLSPEQLNQFGLDSYAIDLLDGPAPVLSWLCLSHNLHRMPIQINRRHVDAKAIEATRQVQRYYTRDGSSSIRFSMYGNRLAQLETRTLQRAKILNTGVDQARVDMCRVKIAENQAARAALKAERDRCREVEADLAAQVEQIESERAELDAERKKLNKAWQQWVKAKSRLETAHAQLKREQSKPSANEQREALAKQLRKLVDKRVVAALGYADATAQAADLQEGAIKVALQALQAESDQRALDARLREKDTELEEKKAELEAATIKNSALLKEGKRLMAAANEALDAADEDLRARVTERRNENRTPQELEDELARIETDLSCMSAVSPLVLEAYNKRKVDIAEQQEKLEAAQERLDDSKTVIETTEKRWRPRLERLVSDISAKFTAAFDTLGLLGEVRLATDDDYEKWGIEIMVSFRDRKDNSQDVVLHVLSGQRQSGGERALTTVTYLLALAELARAPFALVDEINQGMDQRAERNMHKMLVETTCSHDVGQYFLLTPKLLPDLVYHPKMKVLVINVSPYVPSDMSLQGIIDNKRALVRKRKRADAAGGARTAVLAQ